MSTKFHRPLLRYFLFWMLGLSGLCLGIFYLVSGDLRNVESESGTVILQFFALLPIFWFVGMVLIRQFDFAHFFNHRTQPFSSIQYLWVILLTVAVSVGFEGLIGYILTWVQPSYVETVVEQAILSEEVAPGLNILTVLLAVIIAPLMEEIVFRGLIFQRLAIRHGLTTAIVTSSLIFGLLHFESFLGAGVFGVFMCLLFYHTKNLWVPVVVHVINNALAVGIDTWVRADGSYTFVEFRTTMLIYMVGLLGLPLMYIFFRHNWPKDLGQLPILFYRQ